MIQDFPTSTTLNGNYDENGHWARVKMCLVYCGELCDCGPPNGVHVLSADALEEHQNHLNDITT